MKNSDETVSKWEDVVDENVVILSTNLELFPISTELEQKYQAIFGDVAFEPIEVVQCILCEKFILKNTLHIHMARFHVEEIVEEHRFFSGVINQLSFFGPIPKSVYMVEDVKPEVPILPVPEDTTENPIEIQNDPIFDPHVFDIFKSTPEEQDLFCDSFISKEKIDTKLPESEPIKPLIDSVLEAPKPIKRKKSSPSNESKILPSAVSQNDRKFINPLSIKTVTTIPEKNMTMQPIYQFSSTNAHDRNAVHGNFKSTMDNFYNDYKVSSSRSTNAVSARSKNQKIIPDLPKSSNFNIIRVEPSIVTTRAYQSPNQPLPAVIPNKVNPEIQNINFCTDNPLSIADFQNQALRGNQSRRNSSQNGVRINQAWMVGGQRNNIRMIGLPEASQNSPSLVTQIPIINPSYAYSYNHPLPNSFQKQNELNNWPAVINHQPTIQQNFDISSLQQNYRLMENYQRRIVPQQAILQNQLIQNQNNMVTRIINQNGKLIQVNQDPCYPVQGNGLYLSQNVDMQQALAQNQQAQFNVNLPVRVMRTPGPAQNNQFVVNNQNTQNPQQAQYILLNNQQCRANFNPSVPCIILRNLNFINQDGQRFRFP